MKIKQNKRIILSWWLLFSLVPYFVVKDIHHHGSDCGDHRHACSSDFGHKESPNSHPNGNDADHCAICLFVLSPFTEPHPVEAPAPPELQGAVIQLFHTHLSYQTKTSTRSPRAPPHSAFLM